ncbi:MAG TPA: hypothetical protein VHT91_48085 [Kofleriaceae bacterium]|jgi:hypothetical protein|nr:hypothetical protein [Kofleriaceae bacterium]
MRMKTVISSAIIGFSICYGSMARSAAQTIPAQLCKSSGSGLEFDCYIIGGTWASAGVSIVYVDGYGSSGAAGTVLLDLVRYSWTGTRTEQANAAQFLSGTFEMALWSPVMSTNPNQWDYYTFSVDIVPSDVGEFSIFGVGVLSN